MNFKEDGKLVVWRDENLSKFEFFLFNLYSQRLHCNNDNWTLDYGTLFREIWSNEICNNDTCMYLWQNEHFAKNAYSAWYCTQIVIQVFKFRTLNMIFSLHGHCQDMFLKVWRNFNVSLDSHKQRTSKEILGILMKQTPVKKVQILTGLLVIFMNVSRSWLPPCIFEGPWCNASRTDDALADSLFFELFMRKNPHVT